MGWSDLWKLKRIFTGTNVRANSRRKKKDKSGCPSPAADGGTSEDPGGPPSPSTPSGAPVTSPSVPRPSPRASLLKQTVHPADSCKEVTILVTGGTNPNSQERNDKSSLPVLATPKKGAPDSHEESLEDQDFVKSPPSTPAKDESSPEQDWNVLVNADGEAGLGGGMAKEPLPDKLVGGLLSKETSWSSSDDNTVVLCNNNANYNTNNNNNDSDGDETEKADPVKEHWEQQVSDLRSQLDEEREQSRRDRQAANRLQAEAAAREGLREELEKEKMLRAEAEVRLREVRLESDCCKARLATLQEDFRKMEEMVQNMVQFKTRIEQLKHEKSTLTITYESKMMKYQTYIASLEKENFLLLNELKSIEITSPEGSSLLEERDQTVSRLLLERLRLLEQENSSLALENEQQKMQYERCLDDVANQVVQALLAQKSLREECAKLQCRVQDLEEQNRALTVLFRQRFMTQSGKENDLCWPTPGEARLDGTESISRLQSFEQSSQHLKCNVRKHASQSEDSTESLSSLCSDYSLQSCSSGAHHISGCSKLSSPPQWLREQQQLPRPVCAASSLLRERALQSSSPSQLGLWASLLQRHDCLMASNPGPKDDSHLLTYQKLACLNRTPRRPEDWLNLDIGPDWRTHRSKRRSLPLSDQAQSDIADLDSMETPSDESVSFDNLPVLNSSSKMFGGSLFSGAVPSSSKVPSDSGASVLCQLQRSSHSLLFASPPRPNTLNIVPHIMGDPAHNFSFQALERKTHPINSCGNVYEEIDLPPFPISVESDPGLLFNSQYSGESPNCDKDTLPHVTNTVVRRQEGSYLFDSLKKSLENKSEFLHLPSPPLPPPANLSPHPQPPGPSRSPLSSGEHGKDEGYSTMSSDVQAEGNTSGVVSGYAVSSPPVVAPESSLQPHLVAMLSSFSSEALMASSTDSGLSLQLKCAQAKREVSQEEEGFERELSSSLIRCNHQKETERPSEEPVESGQLDSGLGDSPSIHKMTSFRDQSDAVSSMLEDKLLEDLKCHRTSLDYDKILTLLTPRGFRASDSSRPPSIVQSISSEVKVETAEKSTFTEPEEAYVDRSSQGSLLSNNDFSKGTYTKFSETISCASTCSMDCLGGFEDRPTGTSTMQTPNRTISGWEDLLDVYCVSCKYCRLRNHPPHKLTFASRLEALGSLLRAFSDSHLVVRRLGDNPSTLGVRADSLGNRCPPLRLNLLPLERHCSAYDLSPQSESRPLPKDSNPVNPTAAVPSHGEEGGDHFSLRGLQVRHLPALEVSGGGSLSMSTVHSSTSSSGGELAASVEDEPEEEEASAINFGQELTSDSDNDLLESNSFVEQWLQQGTAPIPERLQNGYAYDEEEIGNWSLQLSSEDLSQSSALAPVQWTGDWPPPTLSQSDSVPAASTTLPQPVANEGSRLACIQENVEDDFQDDFWVVPLAWENKNAQKVSETEKTEDCLDDSKAKENLNKAEHQEKEETTKPAETEKPTAVALPETEEELQFEVAEFNRDFYRLCSMDSSRSLDTSNRSLAGGSVCNCPDPRHHHHIHAVDAQENVSLENESLKPSSKVARSRRSHSRESGKENKVSDKASKDSSEKRKTPSRNRERSQGEASRAYQQKKHDKTRIPVIAKSASSQPQQHQQQNKRSAIPRRESDDKLRRHERVSIPKLRQPEGGKMVSPLTSPLRLGNNVLKVPSARIPGNPESTKRFSSARSHSRDKRLLGRIPTPGENDKSAAPQQEKANTEEEKVVGIRKHVDSLKLESRENAVVVRRKGSEGGSRSRWKRSKEGCGTSWVHFEADVDLSDPKARANLLDSMMASSSSGSSSEGEELELVEGEEEETGTGEQQVQQHQHLHALHRIRRHKKRVTDPDAVLSFLPRLRASIIDRHDFYYRFGEKEREAVACFDFLDDLSTSPSDVDTADNANTGKTTSNNNTIADEGSHRLSLDESKLFSCQSSPHNSFSSATLNSQECDHISFSDSCAESYSSSTQSLNRLV